MTKCLALSCLLLAANLAAATVPVVTNPAMPPQIETLTLRELWRVDLDAPEAPLIGTVSAAAAGPDGTVLLLDSQLAQVAVFGADGKFLRFVGRQGEGPGEVTFTFSLVMPGDGRIGMLQSFPPRIVFLNLDGTPAGEFVPQATSDMMWKVRMRDDLRFATVSHRVQPRAPDQQIRSQRLVCLDARGAVVTTFLAKEIVTDWDPPTYDEGTSVFPDSEWDLTADGLLVIAPDRDRYRLEFRAPDGSLVRVAERPFVPRRRTDADRQELAKGVTYTRDDQVVEVDSRLLDFDPAINAVEVDAAGNLWVSHAYSRHDLPAGIAARWDVLDNQGHWLKEVRLAAAIDRDNDLFAQVAPGRWVLVRNVAAASANAYNLSDDIEGLNDEPMVIVCYEAVAK